MAHRNARLTQFGRRLLVQRITELGWPPAQAAESLGCREPPPTSGLPATAPKGRPAWPTAARGRSTAPMPCPLPRSGGCWRPAGAVARVPTGSATTSACPARPSMGAAPPRDEPAGHTDRTSGVAIRYQRERPGELVHLDVKKLGRIPDVAATRSMAAPMPSVAAGSATTMSTRPSMTAPGSPAASSSPTRPGRPRPGSWSRRPAASPTMGSGSSGC
jgi:hypothetical protein